MSKLLTISIAAYNISYFFDKLILSVLSCKRQNEIELLIVNDGSTDDTAQKAEEYEKKYPDVVRLITKQNGGHGSTINTGIEQATGKYFKAVDGDDWIDTENLDSMLANLSHIETDGIISDYWECHEEKLPLRKKVCNLPEKTVIDLNATDIKMTYVCYHAWFFKTSLLKKMPNRLHEHCFYVDTEYVMFPIPDVSTVLYVPAPIYCYRIGYNEQSVSNVSRIKHFDNCLTVFDSITDFYQQKYNALSIAKKAYFDEGIRGIFSFTFKSASFFPLSDDVIIHIRYILGKMKKTSKRQFYKTICKNKAMMMMYFSGGRLAPIIWKHWAKQNSQ